MRALHDEIVPKLSIAMGKLELNENQWLNSLGSSTDKTHGDITLPCHTFSKFFRKSPNDIAIEIANNLGPELSEIVEINIVNGFLNFKARNSWISKKISSMNLDPRLGVGLENRKTIVIDYSSPNIAKRMHVGHLRSTVIGDALSRILSFKGHNVVGENHIGDWGTPFGMLIEHFIECDKNNIGDIDLSTFYREARYKFENIDNFALRSRKRVVKLQSRDEETIDLWQKLVDLSLVNFNLIYQMLGVLLNDDNLAGESIYEDLLPEVVKRLESKNLIVESEGALVVFPDGWYNRENDPLPLIIRKSDGGYNYATTDLACIINRVESIECNEMLYVVGAEQSQHFSMVFQVAKDAEFMDETIKAVHVPFGLVMGSDGKKLASREGKVITLKELLEESVLRAEKLIIEKNPSMSALERNKVSKMIGIGAIKYADLSIDRNKNYVFDWDKMLSFDGNTAPYLQYAHARICSIFRKSSVSRESTIYSEILVVNDFEKSLSKSIIRFSESIDETINSYSPHRLAVYLHHLAQDFASFYENCPVLDTNDETTMNSRLALCNLTARTLKKGLELLGIETPTNM
tara:strand:- start:1194 stop:2921 length:1728 start_codon:yes stop_codon:yes gene_type:complete